MLIDQIKKENIQAMKDRDTNKRSVLSILITKYDNMAIEMRSKGKEMTDADTLSIIQKTVKELDEEAKSYAAAGRPEKAAEINSQMELIHGYLPKQLSEEEIKAEIAKLEDKSIPSVMKHFKTNYAGQVDMGLVSKIARQ